MTKAMSRGTNAKPWGCSGERQAECRKPNREIWAKLYYPCVQGKGFGDEAGEAVHQLSKANVLGGPW